MTKKWIAITLLLLVATGLLGWRLYVAVRQFNAGNDLSGIQPVQEIKQKLSQDRSLPRVGPAALLTPSEFSVIPENNVFSETRSREQRTDGPASTEPAPLTQKPILVGVSIVDDQKRASVIDPATPAQGRIRRSQTKRVGDVYRGYTITDIAPTHIVLQSGARKEIIPLHEGAKRPQGGKTPILSTRVVPIGGQALAGGTQVMIVGGSGAPVRSPAATPAAAVAAPGTRLPGVVAGGGVQPRTPTSTTPPVTQTPQPKVPTTETDAQGRRIIRTPFGNIVRPNRE